MKQTKLNIISALLFVAAMAIETSAWAQDFSIEATYNSSTHKTLFTIERSGSSLPQQTIKYRTVNLSAYAGIHYTAVSDTYTFPENITTFQVEVSESAQYTTAYAYHYQTGTTRSYRFEVLDVNGFELAHNDRSMTTGAQFSNTYLNNGVTDLVYFNDNGQIQSGSGNKYLDVSYSSSNWIQVDDDGYDQGVHTVSTNTLYNSNSTLRTILTGLSYKMYATVYFTQKEEHDGYQYIQIYTGDPSVYDNVDDDNGAVNTLTNSLYRACFILSYSPSGSVMSDPHYQFFPHRYNYVNKAEEIAANITHYEFDYDNAHLYQQKFKSNSYKASTSGSLVLPPTAENINIRFDAGGGGNDKDEWDFKDLKVRLALVDDTYPTLINMAGITVSAGPYVKGNTFYISVPFSEIVSTANYNSYKKLVTSWGDATYYYGDGTNVITFKGTINANAGTTLEITSLQCNFKDLTNTFYQGLGSSNYTDSFDKTFNGVTCTDTYTLAATNTEFTGLESEYVVNTTAIEPHPTVYFYKGIKNSSNKVQLTENTNYTLSWANNTAAGNGTVTATGTGSYTGSASATFPIRWSTYIFRFHDNGSVVIPVTGEMSDQVFEYGVAQNLTANAFSREGFTFAGWNTQPDGNGTAYTNGQSIIGLTTDDGAVIDLYAQWALIPWTGSGDSEDDPYMILYASQLDLLATNVNSGNNYSGKFFKLDADITYGHTTLWNDANSTENNYTAIGTSTNNFRGTFDGDNHTISGIRIYNTDDNQGLFGYANYATIKNVILTDARITCYNDVGGIAGYIDYATTIQSCLVSNAAITGNNKVGAVVGFKFSGTDHLIYNYYLGCIVKNGSTTYYTGIGLGQPQGDYVNEVASLHTLSLSDNITASGESVVIDNVTYYAHLSTITLGYTGAVDAGYNVNYQYNDGTAHAVVGNTFKMPGADVTVSSTFTDVWGIAGGADGSQEHPYIISDTTGLNVLAQCVNGTHGHIANSFNGKFFKLGNDITYSTEGLGENESNYTAIGNYDNKFKGSFDGVNHTISGIRIYTTNDYQGLFGYVYSGSTVKNIALANSIIIGGDYVGSIAGKNEYGTITNCRIGNDVTIGVENDDKDYHGGIVGYQYDGTVSGSVIAASVNGRWYCGGIAGICVFTTLKDCLYTGTVANGSWKGAITGNNNNSTLTNNYYTTDGIGGVNGSDCDGARRARIITLGDNVGIAGDQTAYDLSGITAFGTTALSYNNGTSTTIYSGATQTVTLSDAAPQGCVVTSYSLNGTPLAGNTFTMPDSDVTVSATIGVSYIDADGNERICTDYTLIESSTGSTVILGAVGTETWYAVCGNVNITVSDDKAIKTYGAVHLILMDGATLTVGGQYPIFASGSLSIYGQSLGTGSLTASGSGSAIYVYDGTLTINGGIVTVTSSTGSGIWANNAITINGGNVSASGNGIQAIGTLTLGWHNASDRIYASSYNGDNGVVVKSGQYLSDGTAVYSGTLSTTQVNALASKTLQPAFALTLPKYVNATSGALVQEGHTAYAQAGANVTIAGEGCTLADVTVGGEAATDNGDGTWSFIMPAADATVSATVPLPEVTVTNNVQTICMDNQIQEMEIIYSNGTIESVTGLPENVNFYDTPSGATIFGAPAEYGTFNATVTVTSDQGCGTATADVTITVKPNPEVTVSNNFQTVCENSAITAMEITATHATIENVTGLPTGVSWSKDSSGATGTISGTPTASGTYNVTVTVNSDQTPSCGIAYAYVRITVNPLPEVTLDITGYGDSDGGWNLIASPLAESIAATEVGNLVAETASDFDLYRFNQAANMEWENWKQEESEHYHFNLESGQGYLYASKEDVTLTFLGTPNSDDAVNVSLSYTEGKPLAGFNLVGNPFTVDAYVNRPFYKMNDAGTGIEAIENYNDYTTAQTIPACTGIVVKADNSGESVIFSTTAPSLSAPNNGNLQITLTQANTRGNALLDNAIVSFNEGSQLGKFYFGEQNGNIYIPQGGKEFAIAYSEGMGEMPLNFKARKNGEYTITVNPDNVEMSFLHLIDNLTGADVDLLQTPSYTFSARNDDYASRFKLVFKALGNSSETEEDFAFISNGEIIINGKGIVQVIDLMGRIILADEANRNISTKGFVSGVYVLRLIDGENAKTQKIVIQ